MTFKDLTPLFADAAAFAMVVDDILAHHRGGFDAVAGIEARGFILAAAVGYAAGTGVVPIRKAGKLPWRTLSASYDLEYGQATVEVHEDAFAPGARQPTSVGQMIVEPLRLPLDARRTLSAVPQEFTSRRHPAPPPARQVLLNAAFSNATHHRPPGMRRRRPVSAPDSPDVPFAGGGRRASR